MRHGVLCLNALIVLLASLVFLVAPSALAEGEDPSPSGRDDQKEAPPVEGHKEVPVPPPSVPVRRSDQPTASRAVVMRGLHESIQVNVDSLNNNIVGDAANEPSIAIDPNNPDNIVIGWRQFDSITSSFRQAGYAYSHDGGLTWTFPGVLEPGQFRSDPVLSADSLGNFFYYSLSTTTSAEMFISRDSGLTWEGPIGAFGGDKTWMTIDITGGIGNDNVYALWNSQFTCCAPGTDFTRSIDGGQTYEGPFVMPQHPKWGTLDVGPDGELFVTGATLDGGSHLVLRSSNARDPLQTPVFELARNIDLGGTTSSSGTPNPGGLLGQVWVAVDRSSSATRGNVYVLGSVNPPGSDPLDVHVIRSTDGGQTWSSPTRVNDDRSGSAYQWFGSMSVAPDGRIDVVWNDTREDASAENSELYYSYSTDAGLTWSAGLPVSPSFNSLLGHPQQNKIGDYYHMISDADGAAVAYSATFNGEQDVYFLRVGDCNANGAHDSLDVANMTSTDCNENGVPDECEPDCNGNDIADGCDIDSGTSDDCNDNQIPDECDVSSGASQDCNNDGLLDECDVSDDLETDQGWTVGAPDDTATTGVWERVDPVGTSAQPEDDHTPAPGVFCFVTGQGVPGGSAGDNDIDGGKTTLFSPVLDVSGLLDPHIGYWRWYSNDTGASPNEDVFMIDISDDGGETWTNVETVGPTGSEASGGWFFHLFRVEDLVTPTANVVLRFVAADEGSGSLVEAAIDDLVITDCQECLFDPDCDDGVFCNGIEACLEGSCQSGTAPDCADGDACTVDSCDPVLDACTNIAPPVPSEPANLLMSMSSETVADLTWDVEPDAESYDLYRGARQDASDLACFQTGLTTNFTSDDGLVPAPNEALFHAVAGLNCSGESPLGQERVAADPCP
ncbi:MAG: exo-alpha-sialidase [Acidobacteriota bacterium]|nr:MAG: exo-alpha-sialidase [Acidobacteriota bacterium]